MNIRHIPLTFVAMASVVLFAGCTKNPLDEVGNNIGFTDLEVAYVGATETKAAIDGTTFPAAGEIGLFLFKDDLASETYGESGYSNVKYSYNEDKEKWTASPSIKVGSETGYLYGYYPYQSGNSDVNAIPVSSSLNGDDVMYATKSDVVLAVPAQGERKKIPLDDYEDWMTIGLAAFHRVSQFSKKYKQLDAEMKFKSFEDGNYSPGLGTFFYKCHQYGVIPETIPHYECIPFPVEAFPKRIQDIIKETNLHQNFPVDYIAPCLLFVASLACGNSVVIELQKGWQEKPLLYLAIVGGRGTNKTSCFDFALAPIRARREPSNVG